VLGRLASDPRNTTWIISGRKQSFLDRHLGQLSQIGLSAEHGAFSRAPGCSEWENSAANQNLSWRDEVLDVFRKYTEKTPGSIIEQKQIAVVWHFRNADSEIRLSAAEACRADLKELFAKNGWDLELTHGKTILEVCPGSVNKGAIALRLVDKSQTGGFETDFVICLGDDLTDKDMCALTCELQYNIDVNPHRYVSCSSEVQVLCGNNLLRLRRIELKANSCRLVFARAHSGGGSAGALE